MKYLKDLRTQGYQWIPHVLHKSTFAGGFRLQRSSANVILNQAKQVLQVKPCTNSQHPLVTRKDQGASYARKKLCDDFKVSLSQASVVGFFQPLRF